MYSNPFRFSPVFVLAVGLLSCNQKSLSTLNIPEPSWETDAGRRSFNLTDSLMRELKLTDRLALENSPVATLRAGVRCTQGNKSFVHASQFVLPGKIPLYSFLPIELLRPGVLETSIVCSLYFSARDATNSTHSFSAKEFIVQGSAQAVGIESSSDSSLFNALDFDKAEFRLSDSRAHSMQMICEDFSISANHPDHRDLRLSEFRFPPEFTKGRTNQRCRLIGMENDHAGLISKEMIFRFGEETPAFETSTISTAGRLPQDPNGAGLFSFRIKNPTLDYLRIRLPKANATKLILLTLASPGAGVTLACSSPPVTMSRLDNFRITVKNTEKFVEKDTYYQFEIPSGTMMEGTISSRLHVLSFGGFQIVASEPIDVLTFYGDDWRPVGLISWKISSKSTWLAELSQFPEWPCR